MMKKFVMLFVAVAACTTSALAQKFAFIDQEYILKKICFVLYLMRNK